MTRYRGLTAMDTTMTFETLVPYGSEGLHIPARYVAEVDDPDCPVMLEITVQVIDRLPRCSELRCRIRPGGPPVSTEALRKIPLAQYVRESLTLYSMKVEIQNDSVFVQATGTGDEDVLARSASHRQRHQMTDELLREVAASTPRRTRNRRWQS